MEAQACGRPVIAYKKGGTFETVIDGTTGVHFEKQETESVKNSILRFEELEKNTEVVIEQKIELLEILTGCESKIVKTTVKMAVSVNGKLRDTIEVKVDEEKIFANSNNNLNFINVDKLQNKNSITNIDLTLNNTSGIIAHTSNVITGPMPIA